MKLVFYVLTPFLSLAFLSCSTIKPPHNFQFNYDIENGRALDLIQVFNDNKRTYLKILKAENEELNAFNEAGRGLPLFYDESLKLFFFEASPDSFSLKKGEKSASIKRLKDKRVYK